MTRDPDHPTDLDPYRGRWVARIRGRVVGQGGTPAQALQSAQSARHKEAPEIHFVPMKAPLQFSPLLDQLRAALPEQPLVYLVGGAVRDALLGLPIHDYDLILAGDALNVARKAANALGAAYYALDEERGTARLIYRDQAGARCVLDFAATRGPDLDSDLKARDFTINALAVDLRHPQALLDPLGGAADLMQKRLRACSAASIDSDPVRILRAVRLAAAYDLHILPETRQQMREAVAGLAQVSPERQRDELLRILGGARPHASLQALEMLGALPVILPELPALRGVAQSAPHIKDVWGHTLDTLRVLEGILGALGPRHDPENSNLLLGLLAVRLGRYRAQIESHLQSELVPGRTARSILFLAALYHDIAKPQTGQREEDGRIRFLEHDQLGAKLAAQRAERLHLSNDEVKRIEVIVSQHLRPTLLAHEARPLSRRAIYRFFRAAGPAGVDTILLALADVWATYGHTLPQERWDRQLEVARALLEAWWERPQEQVLPPALINGDDLMGEFGLQAGPIIGEILESVREAQAAGEVNNREEAFAFVRSHLGG